MIYGYDIWSLVQANEKFRQIFLTTQQLQLVAMSVEDQIPEEVHPDHDQFILIVEGVAEVISPDNSFEIRAGQSVTIPAGTSHQVVNKTVDDQGSVLPVKLFTIYGPPEHSMARGYNS